MMLNLNSEAMIIIFLGQMFKINKLLIGKVKENLNNRYRIFLLNYI
jgi:hypothetical protein